MNDDLFPPPLKKHITEIRSEDAHRIIIEMHGTIVLNFLRQLRQRKILRALHYMSIAILNVMLEFLEADQLCQHRLEVEMSMGFLCEAFGREPNPSNENTLARGVKELIKLGVLKRIRKGNGGRGSRFEIMLPAEKTSLKKVAFPVKRLLKNKVEPNTGADPNQALARALPNTSADPNLTPARAREILGVSAGARFGSSPALSSPGHTTDSSSTTTAEEEGGATAAALRNLGIAKKTVAELLQLSTTDIPTIKAAEWTARLKRPEHRVGLIIKCLRDPTNEIVEGAVDRFRREMENRQAIAAGPSRDHVAEMMSAKEILDGLPDQRREELLQSVLLRQSRNVIDSWKRQGVDPLDVPSVRKEIAAMASRQPAAAGGQA